MDASSDKCLHDLGIQLDKLYDEIRRSKRTGSSSQIIFIIGNGIHPVNNILNDKKLRKKARKRRPPIRIKSEEFQAYKWQHFEYARYYSSNCLPALTQCCIARLVDDGLTQNIITTNYDLFFDEIWRRNSNLRMRTNPVAEDGEYLWDGYFSDKKAHTARCYWKIHGSLSHVHFRPNSDHLHHIFRLPRFAISANSPDLAKNYKITTQAPFMGFETTSFPKTQFPEHKDVSPLFEPFIDWGQPDRTLFKREIDGASSVLENSKNIAAIVLLGFSGYWNEKDTHDSWNEELVPVITSSMKAKSNVFMAVHENQYAAMKKAPHCYKLMDSLRTGNRCAIYSHESELAENLFWKNSRCFPYDYAENQHEYWRKHWYLTEREQEHV